MASTPFHAATLRLQRDLKELLAGEPLTGIKASPKGDDIFTWEVELIAADGSFAGKPIQMELVFPETYPNLPPQVKLLTPGLRHPNVFYGWDGSGTPYICLDMIKPPIFYSRPYQGWSTAYTVSSVLLQLYGFLLVDETIQQDWGGRVDRSDYVGRFEQPAPSTATGTAAGAGSGSGSGSGSHVAAIVPGAEGLLLGSTRKHKRSRGSKANRRSKRLEQDRAQGQGQGQHPEQPPSPSSADPTTSMDLDVATASASTAASEDPAAALATAIPSLAYLDLLDDALLVEVTARLSAPELWRCIAVGGRLGRVARDALQRTTLVCFHSRKPHTECLLGFGVAREWHGGRGGSSRPPALRSLSTKADYISLEAFEAGVRKSAWNVPFDAFLPLYLNPEHGRRALAALPGAIHAILQPGSSSSAHAGSILRPPAVPPSPSAVLGVLGQLMNSLVVEIVDVAGSSSSDEIPAFGFDEPTPKLTSQMSDAALAAFCHLHHLLLAAALQPGSGLVEQATRDVQDFVFGGRRSKSACPDLGVLLAKLLLVPCSEVSWGDFAPPFVRELLARQVRWAVQAQGGPNGAFAQPCQLSDQERITMQLSSGVVGLRNVMLQAWFANALARPAGAVDHQVRQTTGAEALGALVHSQLLAIKKSYDECSGSPPPRAFQAFNAAARQVVGLASWTGFLQGLRLGLRPLQGGPKRTWASVLRQAVADSHHQDYHRHPDLGTVLPPRLKASEGGAPSAVGWQEVVGKGRARMAHRAYPPAHFVDWEGHRPLAVISDTWL